MIDSFARQIYDEYLSNVFVRLKGADKTENSKEVQDAH